MTAQFNSPQFYLWSLQKPLGIPVTAHLQKQHMAGQSGKKI